MTVNLAYLTDIASEFATADSSRVDRLVVIATAETPADKWGAQQDIGVAYLVAHMLKIDQLRGGGPVVSKGMGDLSVGQASTVPGSQTPDSFDLTSYGREYKRRRRLLAGSRGPVIT